MRSGPPHLLSPCLISPMVYVAAPLRWLPMGYNTKAYTMRHVVNKAKTLPARYYPQAWVKKAEGFQKQRRRALVASAKLDPSALPGS